MSPFESICKSVCDPLDDVYFALSKVEKTQLPLMFVAYFRVSFVLSKYEICKAPKSSIATEG